MSAHCGSMTKRSSDPEPANPFSSLPEEILFRILDFLDPYPLDKKSISLVSRTFHLLESRHRRRGTPLHRTSIPTALSCYPNATSLSLSLCPIVTVVPKSTPPDQVPLFPPAVGFRPPPPQIRPRRPPSLAVGGLPALPSRPSCHRPMPLSLLPRPRPRLPPVLQSMQTLPLRPRVPMLRLPPHRPTGGSRSLMLAETLMARCANLTELDVSNQTEMGDREAMVIGRVAANLRVLRMARWKAVTDLGVVSIAVGRRVEREKDPQSMRWLSMGEKRAEEEERERRERRRMGLAG